MTQSAGHCQYKEADDHQRKSHMYQYNIILLAVYDLSALHSENPNSYPICFFCRFMTLHDIIHDYTNFWCLKHSHLVIVFSVDNYYAVTKHDFKYLYMCTESCEQHLFHSIKLRRRDVTACPTRHHGQFYCGLLRYTVKS